MSDTNVLHLLQLVSLERKKQEELAEITGENFNIFWELDIYTDEVRLHSRFIGSLLHPKGKHGQGEEFLKLFLKSIDPKLELEYTVEQLKSTEIVVEENIGNISIDETTGGRIDIVIKPSRGRYIVIENKIYAVDQNYQLLRYYKQYPSAHIYYLTLNGKNPNLSSIKYPQSENTLENGNHFHCISYKKHILPWLEECHKLACKYPLLRETLAQYIIVIKNLTGETMDKDTIELIARDGKNVEAAFAVVNSIDQVKTALMKKFVEQMKKLATEKEIELDIEPIGEGGYDKIGQSNQYSGFSFKKKNWEHYKIAFGFDEWRSGFSYGISALNGMNGPLREVIKNKLDNGSNISDEKNPWSKYFDEPYRNWDINSKPWEDVINEAMKNRIKEKLIEILNRLDGVEL
ncbi:MAG: hypothetical protein POELPBGB_00328 [Bacteroidia bacterium]|nr:hypothetical protein [Bacteroidia bacterium]